MKILIYIFFLFEICSCTTIYKIGYSKDSEYILKKGNSFTTYDFEGKDTCSYDYCTFIKENGRDELPIMSLKSKFTIQKKDSFFIYSYFDLVDTLYLKKDIIQAKKSILPSFNLEESFTCSNQKTLRSQHGREFILKYRKDSIHYFNNQQPIKTYVFDYFIINKEVALENYENPITLSISSEDGMPLSIEYFACYPEMDFFKLYLQVQDYRKVFCRKKQLRKFLM